MKSLGNLSEVQLVGCLSYSSDESLTSKFKLELMCVLGCWLKIRLTCLDIKGLSSVIEFLKKISGRSWYLNSRHTEVHLLQKI